MLRAAGHFQVNSDLEYLAPYLGALMVQKPVPSAVLPTLEFLSHHIEGCRWRSPAVNLTQLETIRIYYLSDRKYVFYRMRITVAGNDLKAGRF